MTKIRTAADIKSAVDKVDQRGSANVSHTAKIVGDLMNGWPNDRGLYLQLQRLSEFINKTKAEIQALKPSVMKTDFLPKATDQLDAIVEATAAASHRIMDSADVIMELAGRMNPEDSQKAMAAATSIFEACTFQDITGQRVTKVVETLKTIESHIDRMIAAFDETADGAAQVAAGVESGEAEKPEGEKKEGKSSTLDGPALPSHAPSQADIDAILAGDN
ncbi:MAG: protein phosphatase CheZ [Rhodobacteraceae bacterium]|nr:protein phosphatase CheZ [Paracoccaceae bacterium]